VSNSNRSRGTQFIHDLRTIDFEHADIYTGVRIAIYLAPVLVLGLITQHESSLVVLGAVYVLGIDEIFRPVGRTRTLLSVSVLYASIFAIGMLISMVNDLVIPLLALGLFLISYFRIFSKGFMLLKFAGIWFVIGVATQDTTLTLTGQAFLLVLIGGLWAILVGIIFPAHKFLKPHTTPDQSVRQQNHQQSQAKSTRQDRFKLFRSNLSIHSHYFQFAMTLAITSAVGLLIAQWFELQEPEWILISIVVILMPAYTDISLTFSKVVHRIIGTLIGAIIAIIIISSIDNQWLLMLLLLLFSCAYVSLIKTRNYAFQVIFMTVVILLLFDIPNPSTDPMASFARLQNIIIGSLLSLLAAFIVWIVPKTKSNKALGKE
jgi:Fusaric acid resistance protein-like